MKQYLKLIIFSILLITACSTDYEEVSRKVILKNSPDADLIELEDGTIYTHGIDWVEEREFTKGEKLGVVKEGMATKLPNGAIIYNVKESYPVIIVEYEDNRKKYLMNQGE